LAYTASGIRGRHREGGIWLKKGSGGIWLKKGEGGTRGRI